MRKKKRDMRNLLFLFGLCLAAMLFVLFMNTMAGGAELRKKSEAGNDLAIQANEIAIKNLVEVIKFLDQKRTCCENNSGADCCDFSNRLITSIDVIVEESDSGDLVEVERPVDEKLEWIRSSRGCRLDYTLLIRVHVKGEKKSWLFEWCSLAP